MINKCKINIKLHDNIQEEKMTFANNTSCFRPINCIIP